MSNLYSEKAHPSSIYTRFNTRYVIPLFSYTDTLCEWSQMKIIKLKFPIFWYETFFLFKTSLLLLNFCLCVYYKVGNVCSIHRCISFKDHLMQYLFFSSCSNIANSTYVFGFLSVWWILLELYMSFVLGSCKILNMTVG